MAEQTIVPSTPQGAITLSAIKRDLSLYLRENIGRNWADMIISDENKYITMWEGDWYQIASNHIKTSKFPQAALSWVQMIERDRANYVRDRAPFPMAHRKPDPLNYSLWKDMIDEPAKYGDEVLEVLELEDKLMRAARTRQRVLDYWQTKHVTESQIPAARLIQRAWRNYKV